MTAQIKVKVQRKATVRLKVLPRAPLNLASYIGTTIQPHDLDLDAIAALTGTGVLERDGDGIWSLNTALLVTGSQGSVYTATAGSPQFYSGVLNVKAFGAKGDGSDDTSAVQAAINAAGFGTIYFPKGTYSIGEISGASNKIWLGDGIGITTIQCRAAPAAGHDWIYFLSLSNFGFKGITFDGNAKLTAGVGNYPSFLPCMYLAACNRFIIEDCEFIGWYNCGILTNTSYDFQINKCVVTRSAASALIAYSCIALLGTGTVDSNNLRNFVVSECRLTNGNISVSGHDGAIVHNTITGWGFSAGINTQALASNHSLYIAGNKCFSSNQAADSVGYIMAGIENWARNTIITGNDCYLNYGSGIDCGGADCTITGNNCYNNGAGAAGAGAGISLYADDATFKASGTIVVGNRCTDTRAGGSKTQSYGYYENATLTTFSATGIVVGHNNFEGNATAPMSLIQTGTMATRTSSMASQVTLDTNSGFVGGLFNAITSFSLAGSGGNLIFASAGALGGNRTFNFNPNAGGPRTFSMAGDLTLGANFTTGGGAITLNATGGNPVVTLVAGTYTLREVLTTTRTYYVRTDGGDSNTGLIDSAGGGFLTIQKAINTVAGLDIGTNTVIIQVRTGTFAGAITVSGSWLGSGSVVIQGDTTTPSNVSITNSILVKDGANITLQGLKLSNAGGGCLLINGGSVSIGGKMEFGTCTGNHIDVGASGRFTNSAQPYTISGGASVHWMISGAGGSISSGGSTITISGTPAFSGFFAGTQMVGGMTVNGNTFSGSATGTRYSVSANGVIQTFGAGATYLPGNAAGVTASGGQYL